MKKGIIISGAVLLGASLATNIYQYLRYTRPIKEIGESISIQVIKLVADLLKEDEDKRKQ